MRRLLAVKISCGHTWRYCYEECCICKGPSEEPKQGKRENLTGTIYPFSAMKNRKYMPIRWHRRLQRSLRQLYRLRMIIHDSRIFMISMCWHMGTISMAKSSWKRLMRLLDKDIQRWIEELESLNKNRFTRGSDFGFEEKE